MFQCLVIVEMRSTHTDILTSSNMPIQPFLLTTAIVHGLCKSGDLCGIVRPESACANIPVSQDGQRPAKEREATKCNCN